MIRLFSTKSISAAMAAALVGGFAVYLAPVQSQAGVETQREAALQRPHVKGDRLPPLVTGRACSSASWPNYDRGCQFDLRRPADDVRIVRIVSMEKPVLPVGGASKL
jgi:hypothetical protein